MFVLKVTLEVIAIVLLCAGYWNEEKVIAFERRLWKRLRRALRAGRPVKQPAVRSRSAEEVRRAA